MLLRCCSCLPLWLLSAASWKPARTGVLFSNPGSGTPPKSRASSQQRAPGPSTPSCQVFHIFIQALGRGRGAVL